MCPKTLIIINTEVKHVCHGITGFKACTIHVITGIVMNTPGQAMRVIGLWLQPQLAVDQIHQF